MEFYEFKLPKPDSPEDIEGRIDVLKVEGANRGDAPRCPQCNRPLGMRTWLPPFQIELETWGRHYGDISETGNDLILSERLVEAYLTSGLQGLEDFEPVEVVKIFHRRGKPKDKMPRYYKVTCPFSNTTIDQQASDFLWSEPDKICPECLKDDLIMYYRCQVVLEETWDGKDVFRPRGGFGVLVTERFRYFFHEHRFYGASFIPSHSPEAGIDYRFLNLPQSGGSGTEK